MRRISMRRPAVRWTAAAAAVSAGALALSGCGTQLGAAAMYGNQRISSAQLADQVSNLNAAYKTYQHKVQISYPPAQMPRQVLSWMLRFATADRVAQRTGIRVTPAQAQAQLNAEQARARQSGDSLKEAAVLNGLPPDLLYKLGRWIAIQLKLQVKLDNGVTPKSSAAQQALVVKINRAQCRAAKSLDIKVNPQFGAYDYGQLAVVAQPSSLAAGPAVAKSSPTPSPKTTC